MTSRRPMTRSYSGNGRTSSFSEEEGSSSNGRSESRNTYLSNVRPENSYSRYSHYRPTRSTLCSVMAQLTEDIQPSFETTLKSKAVSENCNVKFTCVVSGYPAPELTWYKDDMEMDRYCGLPKYEIRRNGKTHTLHIYNCTLDDAAIYQASANNSKGIVSCSGVLEVGTMNEYKIHQRFFAKLKQKAENKKKELEESKKKGKENVRRENARPSPERSQRKRPVPPPKENPVVQEPEAVEQLGAAALEPNGVGAEVRETAPVTSTENDVDSPTKKAKKKIKLSNGVDASGHAGRGQTMGNGGENSYDGGIGLAQFLAEALHSQAVEEKPGSLRAERPAEMDTSAADAGKEEGAREAKWKEREEREREQTLAEERERERRTEQESAAERERGTELSHKMVHSKHASDVKHLNKAHKDHDHHNIQASISSVLHTVKDFFFGKSKKDSHDHRENEEGEFYNPDDHVQLDHSPPEPQTPPLFRPQPEHNTEVNKLVMEAVAPMELATAKEPSLIGVTEQSVSPTPYGREVSVSRAEDLPEPPLESATDSVKPEDEEADDAVEAMETSVEVDGSSAGRATEAKERDSEAGDLPQQEPTVPAVLPEPATDETRRSPTRDLSSRPQTQASGEDARSPASSCGLGDSRAPPNSVTSTTDSRALDEAPSETSQEIRMLVDKMGSETEPDTKENPSPNTPRREEKAEVKSEIEPRSQINAAEVNEARTSSLEERIESRDSETPHQVPVILIMDENVESESDHLKETERTSPFQEINVEFPATVAPASSENGDPEVLQEFPPMKSIDDCGFGSNERSHSALERNEGSVLNEGFTSALEKKLEVNSLNPTIQEQAFSKVASAEEPSELLPRNEVRTVAIEREFEMEKGSKKVGELDELNSHSGASKIENASVSEEPIKAANPDATERHLEGPIENVPEIQIFNSVIEDIPDIKLTVPEVRLNEQIIIPNADVMQSEMKEPSMTGSPVTEGIPTQTSMLNHDNVPSTEKTQEVAQLDDKEKMHNSEQPFKKTSEPVNPPQMDYASIPIINVSCTDDNVSVKHLDSPQPGEAPMVPLFVVPPISVICDDSTPENKLPTQNEHAGRDSSAPTLRGEKGDLEGNITIESEKTHNKKQNIEAGTKSTVENTPSVLSEALMPIEVITNMLSLGKTPEDVATETLKMKPLKKARTESDITVEERQTDKPAVERLDLNTPALPPLSPASLRKFVSKPAPVADAQAAAAVPAITVGDSQNDKTGEEMSGGSTPTSSLSCESSPRLKRRDSLSLIRSATPEELASGARRKIFIPKAKGEDGEGGGGGFGAGALDAQGKKETPYMSPSQARRAALLQAPTAPGTPPMERRSPLLSRRKATLEVPKVVEETSTEETASTKPEDKPAEKLDPFKAPQVIRKIRGEPFPDASGHLKLWCQFFNVLSDSTIKWYRDEEEILEVKKSGGDESQVALAIVLASSHDCGVYGCTIKNEYGTDTTDFLLSVDILSEILLRDDLEVGEEIEMTPMLFTKGLVDPGCWGEKFFGRIMTKETHLGEGCGHKASKVKVIYGLDPVFDSGTTCIIKVQNPIAYGTKEESNLTERNLEITKQECKIQNMIREYCKIFAAEARVIENFGFSLEIIPQYLMYRPANSVPYATVEVDLDGVFLKYCMMDTKGRLITRTVSEVEQKCSTFQHWIHQWTHGNLLVTHLEGVGTKLTNVRVVTKSKGYQGLTECGSPKVFEQFLTHHQCNYYCGLLSLRPLKTMDSLQQPTKIKGSRSPLLNRKLGSSSPQLLRKGTNSPQMSRKATSSPKVTRKAQETEDNKSNAKPKPADTLEVVQMR